MARGDPDPRLHPQPLEAVPGLVATGADHFNARRYWDAHEAWEEAWHAVRAAGDAAAADFIQGLTVVTAGFENAARGKEKGFRRQVAKGLVLARGNVAAADRVGVVDARTWVEAVTGRYLEAAAHIAFEHAFPNGVDAPPLTVSR